MKKIARKKKAPMPPGPERDALIRKRYLKEGVRAVDIADEVGVTRSRMNQILDEMRILKPTPTRMQRQKVWVTLIRQGMTLGEMGEKTGMSRSTITKDIADLGLTGRLAAQKRENWLRDKVTRRTPPPADVAKRRAAIPKLIREGYSLQDIGKKFKVAEAIHADMRILRAQGVITERLEQKIHENRVAANNKTRKRKAR